MRPPVLFAYALLLFSAASAVSAACVNLSCLSRFSRENSYNDITKKLKRLAKNHGQLVSFESIGETRENREIAVVRIKGEKAPKKGNIIWVNGGVRGNDVTSVKTAIFLIKELVTGYGKNDAITKLLDAGEIIILPCHNPDGYELSRKSNFKPRPKATSGSAPPDNDNEVDLSQMYPILSALIADPTLEHPEVAAVVKMIDQVKISGFIELRLNSESPGILRPSLINDLHEVSLEYISATMIAAIDSTVREKYESKRLALPEDRSVLGPALNWALGKDILSLAIEIEGDTSNSDRLREILNGFILFAEFARNNGPYIGKKSQRYMVDAVRRVTDEVKETDEIDEDYLSCIGEFTSKNSHLESKR